MRIIHKVPYTNDMTLPAGSRVLYGGYQDRQIQIWFEDPSVPDTGDRAVRVEGVFTGQPVPEDGRYVNTMETLMKLILHFYAFNEPAATTRELFKS